MADLQHQVEHRLPSSQGCEDVRLDAPIANPVTDSARERIAGLSSLRMAQIAERILAVFEAEIGTLRHAPLPPVHLIEGEDGSVSLEWMFPHFRLGFSIESEDQDSNWFFVSDESAGLIHACGRLSDASVKLPLSLVLAHLG